MSHASCRNRFLFVALGAGRAGIPIEAIAERSTKLPEWEGSAAKPTLKEVEALAKATLTPVGYFFPPESPLAILGREHQRRGGDGGRDGA